MLNKTYTFNKSEAEQRGFTETYEVEDGTLFVDSTLVAVDSEGLHFDSRGYIDWMNDVDRDKWIADLEARWNELEAMGFSDDEIEAIITE